LLLTAVAARLLALLALLEQADPVRVHADGEGQAIRAVVGVDALDRAGDRDGVALLRVQGGEEVVVLAPESCLVGSRGERLPVPLLVLLRPAGEDAKVPDGHALLGS